MPALVTPKLLEPPEAARVLASSLGAPTVPLTVADAAAKSGLPLRDVERGLHFLTSEYRGHLRVTSEGDLLFLFPTGFTKPWQTRDAFDRGLAAVGRVLASVARFIVRAWLTIALVAYAAAFIAILVGLTFARTGDNNNRRGRGGFAGGEIIYVLLRVLGDALFWTFHPFSPSLRGQEYADGRRGFLQRELFRRERESARVATKRRSTKSEPLLLRAQRPARRPPRARAGDPRDDSRAEGAHRPRGRHACHGASTRPSGPPMMARLMLDYEGDVSVSEEGGITYRFASLRKTAVEAERAEGETGHPPASAWARAKELLPLTGNGFGANAAIFALNGFNLLMSVFALDAGLTLEKLRLLFARIPLEAIPDSGTAIVLGVVPLVMSIALFVLPIARAALRPLEARRVTREKARLAVLRTVLTRVEAKTPVTDAALVSAWKSAAGWEPASIDVTREVVALGGDAEIQESGEVRYRFPDLETEEAALEEERAAADDEEKRVGRVVFASDD